MNEFIVNLKGIKKQVQFINGSEIFIDDVRYEYELKRLSDKLFLLKLNNKFYEIHSGNKNGNISAITVNGESFEVLVRSALQEKAANLVEQKNTLSHKMEVKAPMPGMIVKYLKDEGSPVKQGDAVLILEAMKMENEVRSPFSGTIKKIFKKEGMAVEKGSVIFLIE
jgi:biotin carboxyl carrier protein